MHQGSLELSGLALVQSGQQKWPVAFFYMHLFPIYAFLVGLTALLPACEVRGGSFDFFEPLQPPRPYQVMVHRGAINRAPENSRPALQRCIEDSFEWVEVDVRLTKDGKHILCHDATLQEMNVAEHTLAELQALDIGRPFAARFTGEHSLSLAEGLVLAKGKLNLYLDCKLFDPKQLAHDVQEAGMEKQVVVYASLPNLHEVDEAAGGRLALMAKWRPGTGIEPFVATNHLAAVEIDADQITSESVRAFHDLGVKVQVKVLNEWDQIPFWDKALAAGADWFQTDLPEEILAHALWQRVKQRPVRFSLHRGANRYAPENTLPAFAKAIQLGADFVEFDVRTTSDGKFYLLHDGSLDGKTDGHGLIANTPSSIIETRSAGIKFGKPFAKEPLPTLDEFLSSVEGKIDLYFDAKAITPEALAEAVNRHHMADRTVVYQSVPYLMRLKAIDPRIRALPPLGSPDQLQSIVDKFVPYAFDTRWNILSKELIDRCHKLGIKVFSDALGEHETIQDYLQAMEWGIDLIQTDHPMRLLRAIELYTAKQRK